MLIFLMGISEVTLIKGKKEGGRGGGGKEGSTSKQDMPTFVSCLTFCSQSVQRWEKEEVPCPREKVVKGRITY